MLESRAPLGTQYETYAPAHGDGQLRDVPIRRGNGEFRDTTFEKGGADHRGWHGDRTGGCAGVRAGRRQRRRRGAAVGEAESGGQRKPKATRGGVCGGRGERRAGGGAYG